MIELYLQKPFASTNGWLHSQAYASGQVIYPTPQSRDMVCT